MVIALYFLGQAGPTITPNFSWDVLNIGNHLFLLTDTDKALQVSIVTRTDFNTGRGNGATANITESRFGSSHRP